MKNRLLGVIMTNDRFSAVIDGKEMSTDSSNPNWEEIKDTVLKSNDIDVDKLIQLIDKVSYLKHNFDSLNTGLEIDENEIIYHNGQKIPDVLRKKILNDLDKGYNIKNFCEFVKNLMKNPSMTSVNELYLFLEQSLMPLTEDGCFLAYKKINKDYTDCHTGTIDNSVGQIVKEERNTVDDNRDNTCSNGLHFCSYSYLKSFGGSRVVVLKINPKDVVSIPSDYNNAKGRCCEYEVIAEIDYDEAHKSDVFSERDDGDQWMREYACEDEYDEYEICFSCNEEYDAYTYHECDYKEPF